MKIWGYKTCTQVRHRVSQAAGLSHWLTEAAAGPGGQAARLGAPRDGEYESNHWRRVTA